MLPSEERPRNTVFEGEDISDSEHDVLDWLKSYEQIPEALDEEGYHELYLQQGGSFFGSPIRFEDGMDYSECELYYASLDSQEEGGSPRISLFASSQEKRPSCLQDAKGLAPGKLASCMRRPKYSSSTASSRPHRQIRRCSFSGNPARMDESPERWLQRSNSSRAINEHKPRVAFEEVVQVMTISPAAELPPDVRSGMWLSRQEMNMMIQRAVLEERQRKAKEQMENLQERKRAICGGSEAVATTAAPGIAVR